MGDINILEYQGVFLNQPFSGATPHYSVNAPEPYNFGSFESYLLSWAGTDVSFQDVNVPETGVVFQQSGATATAQYKAYLRSSSNQVTAPTGQRKIIRDLNGVYHLAYESGNEIWYTKSTNGTSWDKEILVSEGEPSYYNRSPSVTVQDAPHKVMLVWEAYLPDNSGQTVLSRTVDPVSKMLGPLEDVSVTSTGSMSPMIPVVGAGVSAAEVRYVLCTWYDGYDGKLKGAVRNTSGAWTTAIVIRTGSVSQITLTPISPLHFLWQLAWTENGSLYHMELPVTSPLELGDVELVAQGSVDVINQNPSIANGVRPYSFPSIVWEQWKPELTKRVIKYRERHMSQGWSSTVTTWQKAPGPSDYRTPTLSTNHNVPSTNDVAIVWLSGTSQLVHVKREGGTWGSATNLATGLDPSISVGWTNPLQEKVVHRAMSGPLFAVQRSTVTFSPQLKLAGVSSLGEVREGRGGKLFFLSGSAELVMLRTTLNGELLSFRLLPDTVKVRKLVDFVGFLKTDAFLGNGDLYVELLYTGIGELPSDLSIGVVLRDDITGELLSILQSFSNVGDTVVSASVPLRWGIRSVRLGFEPIGRTPVLNEFELGRWFQVDEDSLMAARLGVAPETPLALVPPTPKNYVLHPAFPNPFNPTTSIKYELPRDSHVSLKVYDVRGREVVRLVDRVHTAGHHQIDFNASDLSSGIYFYRLKADDFVETKRLLLLK